MNIILNELKKIFELKIVLLMIVISFIFYHLFISFEFEYFPNGRPALDLYHVGVEMVEDYGTSFDEQDYLHFKNVYQKKVEAADDYLLSKKEFVDAGITTYQQFRQMDLNNKKVKNLSDKVLFEEKVDLFWELQARESLMEIYEHKEYKMNYNDAAPTSKKQKKRIKEVIDNGSAFPDLVFWNYNNLITNLSMLVLVSIMLMLSPINLRDRRNKLIFLQYTSKTGRELFKRKILTGLLSSFIITTLHLLWFFAAYSQNHVAMFFDSNINSFFQHFVFWFDFTFFQYIILTVVALYFLAFVMSIIVAVLSSMVPNYLSIIGVQVPIAFITFSILLKYLITRLTEISLPIYFLPVAYTVLIAIGIIISIFRWKKEKRLDIVY
ncbi:hypothetical protein [Bacillus sp. 03113]|uniref:hypothetical protein n=1 Tax=Bacillus sp. 03113 TaxID=2578211 RepID=UPI001143DF2D|nr:hypothetical protein [Bacillus sp. 03113]